MSVDHPEVMGCRTLPSCSSLEVGPKYFGTGEHAYRKAEQAAVALPLCSVFPVWHPSAPIFPVSGNSASLVNVADRDKLRERRILPTAMEDDSYVLLF